MKKAFTLIELLVVIAIISILAAILFPAFAQAKTAAKSIVDLSNVKQLALAIITYSNDSDDAFPLAIREEDYASQQIAFPPSSGTSLATDPPGAIPWQEAVYPYTKNREIYQSRLESNPSGVGPVTMFEQDAYFGVVPRAASFAYRDSSGNFRLATGMANGGVGAYIDGPFGLGVSYDAAFVTGYAQPSLTTSGLDHPSDEIMIADAGAYDMGFLSTLNAPTGSATTPACFPIQTPNPYTQTLASNVYVGPWSRFNVSGSYNGGKNCSFDLNQQGKTTFAACDGSARKKDLRGDVYQVKASGSNPVFYRMYSGSAE